MIIPFVCSLSRSISNRAWSAVWFCEAIARTNMPFDSRVQGQHVPHQVAFILLLASYEALFGRGSSWMYQDTSIPNNRWLGGR